MANKATTIRYAMKEPLSKKKGRDSSWKLDFVISLS
jgi:hypothetical protein